MWNKNHDPLSEATLAAMSEKGSATQIPRDKMNLHIIVNFDISKQMTEL